MIVSAVCSVPYDVKLQKCPVDEREIFYIFPQHNMLM